MYTKLQVKYAKLNVILRLSTAQILSLNEDECLYCSNEFT